MPEVSIAVTYMRLTRLGVRLMCLALAMLLLLPNGRLARAADLPLKFDFGTMTSPVNAVYDKASVNTLFAGRYGWTKPTALEERDRGGEDPIARDFVFGTQPATFRIALPNGDYLVTMTYCDMATGHQSFAVRVGDRTGYEMPGISKGESVTAEIVGHARKGILDIGFMPLSEIWLVNALTVTALEPGMSFPSPRYTTSASKEWRALTENAFDAQPYEKLRLMKPVDYDAPDYPGLTDYMRVLERFPLFAERGWHPDYRGLADVGYFGGGDKDELSLRPMGNFIFTCALLASDPSYDPRPTSVSREKLLDYARQCLRYMTRTHVTGDLECASGGKWGGDWQSSWWTGKMAAGAHLMWNDLSSDERAAVERVAVYEADRHLARTAPGGATSNTRSEENAWDTEALAAALALFPDHEHAPKWWRKLQDFSMNTLSVPQDTLDPALVDHKPVKDWVYTANIHSDFTIENHGAYHFCYMACPLHSLAWGWYNLTSSDRPVPQALFHHYTDVWDVVRRTFLYDGRFAYISGKDWPRYAYGLSFIMPACALMQEVYGDRDARLFEKLRFETFEREQVMNGDGSFFGRRFTANRMQGRPVQFETDAYGNLGVCYLMHKMSRKPLLKPSDQGEFQRRVAGARISKDSAWVLGRSPKVFTSFSWRELGGPFPMGLFIPQGCDDMAEWGREQLTGSFSIEGCDPKRRQVEHAEKAFDGGFWTAGRVTYVDTDGRPTLNQGLALVSLPEEGIALLMDHAVAANDIKVNSQEGLKYYLANDVFNSGVRKVRSPSGEFTLWGGDNAARTSPDKATHVVSEPWISVDGKLSLVALTSNSPFTARDLIGRTDPFRSLEHELISLPYIAEPHSFYADGLVRYSVVVLAAGDSRVAAEISKHSRLVSSGSGDVRCAVVSRDGRRNWLVAVNLSDRPASARIEFGGSVVALDIEPWSVEVRCEQQH